MFNNVKKLLFVDAELASQELQSIEGKKFFIKGNSLQNEEQETICKFDYCRAGNKLHNAICLIRDMHNVLNPDSLKTKPQVERVITVNTIN